jgi:hypothetical protein
MGPVPVQSSVPRNFRSERARYLKATISHTLKALLSGFQSRLPAFAPGSGNTGRSESADAAGGR